VSNSPWGGAGLPDGIFAYQKFQFGYILEGLGMEIVGIFYGNSTAIWFILWSFGIALPVLVFYVYQEKSGKPLVETLCR
jgi:uncharacterized membrane protein